MADFDKGGMFPGDGGFSKLHNLGVRQEAPSISRGRAAIAFAMRNGETPPPSRAAQQLAAEAAVFSGPVVTAETVAAKVPAAE